MGRADFNTHDDMSIKKKLLPEIFQDSEMTEQLF